MAGIPLPAAVWRGIEPVNAAGRWNEQWDRAIIEGARTRADRNFDSAQSMLQRHVSAAYNYHSALRDVVAHPTRDSLEYALMLLESAQNVNHDRAYQIIERVVGLQNTDPSSRWYGLWGYYLEEPLEKMAFADWNWADFNGCSLLLILHRHGARLPRALRTVMLDSLGHAAESVRRRNVSMSYTNIAAMGTFLTFSAAEMLGDAGLLQYACDRVRRFASAVDESGSFGEYNSPTYANVTLAQLASFRMFVVQQESKAVMRAIEERVWLHLACHWHPPTRQFAGPMSRCYSTLLSDPLWLQKSLDNRLVFASLEELKTARRGGEGRIGIVDWKCPAALLERFLRLDQPLLHREVFLLGSRPSEPGKKSLRPVQGTTYLAPRFCLGTINRADFWVQRRPLLAYWGQPKSPAYLQLRMIKDDYDFASGVFYSVQNKNWIVAAAGFRADGGDKHVNLDPVRDGTFVAQRLYLQVLISGFEETKMLLDGRPARPDLESLPLEECSRLTLQVDDAAVAFLPRVVEFAEEKPTLSVRLGPSSDSRTLTIEIDLFRRRTPETVHWSEINSSFCGFGLVLEVPGRLDSLDERVKGATWKIERATETIGLRWSTEAGELGLTAGRKIAQAGVQNALFQEKIDGRDVPLVRLSQVRLAPG
jgi:hypothetical protein